MVPKNNNSLFKAEGIAKELVVTVGMVKRHVINLFQKLKADNRTQAVV